MDDEKDSVISTRDDCDYNTGNPLLYCGCANTTTTEMISDLITGATIESGATFIKCEKLDSVSGVITLANTPIAGTVNVFAADDDCGAVLPSTVNVSQKTVTVTGATGNDSYIVYYQTQVTDGVYTLKVKSTTFPSDELSFCVEDVSDWCKRFGFTYQDLDEFLKTAVRCSTRDKAGESASLE